MSEYAAAGSRSRILSTRLTASTNVGQSRADSARIVLMMLAIDSWSMASRCCSIRSSSSADCPRAVSRVCSHRHAAVDATDWSRRS